MDHILLCSNQIPLVTSIHNAFIEDYMLEANGSYVKVYLYLAKCIQHGEQGLSICSLADRMDNTEKDVLRALQYWEKKHLMHIKREDQTGEILGIEMLLPAEATDSRKASPGTGETPVLETAATTETMPSTHAAVSTPKKEQTERQDEISVSPQQLQKLASDQDFVWVCHVVESYLERPMKSNETRLITYLYDTLHFSKDLLLYLYDYCISAGKTNCNYIQTVALSWHERGIHTPEEAKHACTSYNAAYTAVSKALALGRGLAAIEKQFVDRWQNTWDMDLSVILEACNRTVLKLHSADFKYTEGILERWRKADVHTLQDVEKSDQAYAQTKKTKTGTAPSGKPRSKNQFQNFQQRDVSAQELNELERKLLMH